MQGQLMPWTHGTAPGRAQTGDPWRHDRVSQCCCLCEVLPWQDFLPRTCRPPWHGMQRQPWLMMDRWPQHGTEKWPWCGMERQPQCDREKLLYWRECRGLILSREPQGEN